MDPKALKVLAVHGIGDHSSSLEWQVKWNKAAQRGMEPFGMQLANNKMEFVVYNNIYKDYPATTNMDYLKAAGNLASNYFRTFWVRSRGVRSWFDPQAYEKYDMVVQWLLIEQLRIDLRKLLVSEIDRHRPDVICGHSLGSIICYDTLSNAISLASNQVFVSLGSQLGYPAIKGQFGGRLTSLLPGYWFHLHNKNDHSFTSTIPRQHGITQIETPFLGKDIDFDLRDDEVDSLNHSAVGYFSDNQLWGLLKQRATGRARALSRSVPAQLARMVDFGEIETATEEEAQIQPRRRALLVGINEYPDPSMRLEGCVNDVFTISSVLQECGFAADDIRVVFDDRATKQGLVERLHWLLDDARPGDELVFSFCGHGAQVPTYNPMGHVDHMTECLVPYDYDWSLESALSDVDLQDMYSQLPYDTRFLMLLDCCHSGGLARDGGRVIRGLNPPDDIRHRMLRWDVDKQMWVRRKFAPLHADFKGMKDADDYVGETGDVLRLGSAMPLRGLSNEEFDRVTKERGHHGPYMPLIVHACQEDEFAYEYQHGVISHGAFTFVLSNLLRDYNRGRGFTVSFEELVSDAAEELMDLGYDQNPDLAGPEEIRQADIPWGTTLERRQQRRKRRRNKS